MSSGKPPDKGKAISEAGFAGISDRLGTVIEARPSRLFFIVLIILSVLPFPSIDQMLRPLFLVVFGLELGVRVSLMIRREDHRTWLDYVFLVVDICAFVSFLPLPLPVELANPLRLARLMVLLRFARELARDVYSVLTRREQIQQFGLVTLSVLALAFSSAVVLTAFPHRGDVQGEPAGGFWDRMWWSFRQLESPDNLVPNLDVHPLIGILSLTLTIMGVFVVSFIIGLGSNVVGQVVRAERRRPVAYHGHSLLLGAVGEAELLVREFLRIYEKNSGMRRIHPREVWEWLVKGAPAPRRHALPRVALLGQEDSPPDYLYRPGMRWVIYRSGEGGDPESLLLAGAEKAKRAILLSDRSAGHDADALTLAGLSALRDVNRDAHAFVEIVDSDNEELALEVGGPGTFPLDVPRFLGLFLVHHLILPGAEKVFGELLTADGSEFYTHIFVDRREIQAVTRLSESTPELSFTEMAQVAARDHNLVLTGVFLGKGDFGRSAYGLIPVDRLTQWINPLQCGEDHPARALGASPGKIPTRHLRGIIGVSKSYMPVRRFSRQLLKGLPRIKASNPKLDDALVVPSARTLRRLLVVGYSPALGALIRGTARFIPGVELIVALSARGDAKTSLEDRLRDLDLGINLDSGIPTEIHLNLPRGGTCRILTHEAANLSRYAVKHMDGPVDAAIFLSDPESLDPDARTFLRVLRFARALERGEAPRGAQLHLLAELASADRGHQLQRHISRTQCGFLKAEDLRLTLVSTDQLRNYFMVHSAFVPGVTELYDGLLETRGPALQRYEIQTDHALTFRELQGAMAAGGDIPIAVETDSNFVLNPKGDAEFEKGTIKAVYALTSGPNAPPRPLTS